MYNFHSTDLTTYLGYLQPLLSNYCDGNRAQILNRNYLKGLGVGGSSTTTFNVNEGTTTYSNGIISITETADNKGLLFDVNTSPLQPLIRSTNKLPASDITGLSSVATNITNASNINGCSFLYNITANNFNALFPSTTIDGASYIIH